ncbi:hypothetical protein [Salsuginibacillus kocurii]|uniref:hypothetical protein n=1 Tax=Salsuginibacillus kocurii TaxID=427078 RepID=UPI00037D4A4F|nr:hypothetical protein [Salsuginibacillus kocurii]
MMTACGGGDSTLPDEEPDIVSTLEEPVEAESGAESEARAGITKETLLEEGELGIDGAVFEGYRFNVAEFTTYYSPEGSEVPQEAAEDYTYLYNIWLGDDFERDITETGDLETLMTEELPLHNAIHIQVKEPEKDDVLALFGPKGDQDEKVHVFTPEKEAVNGAQAANEEFSFLLAEDLLVHEELHPYIDTFYDVEELPELFVFNEEGMIEQLSSEEEIEAFLREG